MKRMRFVVVGLMMAVGLVATETAPAQEPGSR